MPDALVSSDNTVVLADGSTRIVESMFSTVCDLAGDHAEVLCRLHPARRQAFDRVLAGGQRIAIELHVNNLRDGGVTVIDYVSLAASGVDKVIGQAQARHFDPGAEPLIRQVRDKSFRLLFHRLPPAQHVLGEAFDLEHFCDALVDHCTADMHQDDRAVFYIAPSTSADQIKQILTFLRDYRGLPPLTAR